MCVSSLHLFCLSSEAVLTTPALCFVVTVNKSLKIRLPAYSLQAGFVTLNIWQCPVPVLLSPSATAADLPRCELPGPIWLQRLQGHACRWPLENVPTYMNQDRWKTWSDVIKNQYGARLLGMCCTWIFILALQ